MRPKGYLLALIIFVIVPFCAYVFFNAFFKMVCTNSDGHLIWYTEGNSCSYINYESCAIKEQKPPRSAQLGCTDQQKIAVLHRDKDIQLIGYSSDRSLPKACTNLLKRMYESVYASRSEITRDYWLAVETFNRNWGIDKDNIANACKPFVSDDLYQKILQDSRVNP